MHQDRNDFPSQTTKAIQDMVARNTESESKNKANEM